MLEALGNLIHHLNHRVQLFIDVLHILRKRVKIEVVLTFVEFLFSLLHHHHFRLVGRIL